MPILWLSKNLSGCQKISLCPPELPLVRVTSINTTKVTENWRKNRSFDIVFMSTPLRGVWVREIGVIRNPGMRDVKLNGNASNVGCSRAYILAEMFERIEDIDCERRPFGMSGPGSNTAGILGERIFLSKR